LLREWEEVKKDAAEQCLFPKQIHDCSVYQSAGERLMCQTYKYKFNNVYKCSYDEVLCDELCFSCNDNFISRVLDLEYYDCRRGCRCEFNYGSIPLACIVLSLFFSVLFCLCRCMCRCMRRCCCRARKRGVVHGERRERY
jgi:hypothetical protein